MSATLHDTPAELIVLGAMLLSPDVAYQVADIITADDFYQPNHTAIYGAISGALAAGEPVDAVAISQRLAASGDLVRVGGAPYLHQLISSVPTATAAPWHARQLVDLATRRNIAAAAIRIHQRAGNLETETADVVNAAQADLHAATTSHQHRDATAFGDGLDAEIEAICNPGPRDRGLSTGIGALDDVIGGLKPGQLIVIGGRPGAGKSVLGTDMVRATSFRARKPTLLRSLEMSTSEIRMRILAAECQINLYRVTNGPLHEDERVRLRAAADRLRACPLFIDDASNGDLAGIRASARRIQQRHGLALLVVDYLQLMTSSSSTEGRTQEVAAISRGLKNLARELHIPVVAAAQLNRQSEQRTDRRPQLSDLRESGAIEADADIVILLHRPDYNEPEHKRAGEIDLIAGKNRNGPQETVTAAAQLQFARIVDMATEYR